MPECNIITEFYFIDSNGRELPSAQLINQWATSAVRYHCRTHGIHYQNSPVGNLPPTRCAIGRIEDATEATLAKIDAANIGRKSRSVTTPFACVICDRPLMTIGQAVTGCTPGNCAHSPPEGHPDWIKLRQRRALRKALASTIQGALSIQHRLLGEEDKTFDFERLAEAAMTVTLAIDPAR